MARIPRIVIPQIPHHITQRGNRRQQTFFSIADYQAYLEFLATACKVYDVEIWAYCLMPNHVHLIAVPGTEKSLQLAMGDCHQRYSKLINYRFGWNGYLWQGRFKSFPMDEKHLYYAARYVELNPVRAGICKQAEDYLWSSALAHLNIREDKYVSVQPLLSRFPDWRYYLNEETDPRWTKTHRSHSSTGRPLGSKEFVSALELSTGRILTLLKRGPKTTPLPDEN